MLNTAFVLELAAAPPRGNVFAAVPAQAAAKDAIPPRRAAKP